MSTRPVSIYIYHSATVFHTTNQEGRPTATTDETHALLADWKGERSRRVPGEASTAANEVSEEHSEPRGRQSGDRALGERQRCEPRAASREPRAHESAGASGEFSGSASKTQSPTQT